MYICTVKTYFINIYIYIFFYGLNITYKNNKINIGKVNCYC